MDEVRGGWSATITADVRYCKQLPNGAKLLYAEINSLCNYMGYCWATNKYFADLYEVDGRTIRRWISRLIALKFIETTNEKNGHKGSRKLYIYGRIQKISNGGQNCPKTKNEKQIKKIYNGGQKCPGTPDKIAPLNIKKELPIKKKIIIKPEKSETRSMPAEHNNNFYKCIDKCENLSEKQKKMLMKYPEQQVKDAIRYVYHPTTTLQGDDCHIKMLLSFLKNPDSFANTLKNLDNPVEKKSKKDQVLGNFKHGKIYNGYECLVDDIGIGFYKSPMIQPYSVKWQSPNFKSELLLLLKKLNIQV